MIDLEAEEMVFSKKTIVTVLFEIDSGNMHIAMASIIQDTTV